ncbi:hypothetical protein BDZ91DRAFT_520384 [Kalaharituber pfeilii]|nr:hypothetical protein BDZ91DRAFT_520384 [Kalaharituber pfeilii]
MFRERVRREMHHTGAWILKQPSLPKEFLDNCLRRPEFQVRLSLAVRAAADYLFFSVPILESIEGVDMDKFIGTFCFCVQVQCKWACHIFFQFLHRCNVLGSAVLLLMCFLFLFSSTFCVSIGW